MHARDREHTAGAMHPAVSLQSLSDVVVRPVLSAWCSKHLGYRRGDAISEDRVETACLPAVSRSASRYAPHEISQGHCRRRVACLDQHSDQAMTQAGLITICSACVRELGCAASMMADDPQWLLPIKGSQHPHGAVLLCSAVHAAALTEAGVHGHASLTKEGR